MADTFDHYWDRENRCPEVLLAFRNVGLDDWDSFDFVTIDLITDDIIPFIDAADHRRFYELLRNGIRRYCSHAASAPALAVALDALLADEPARRNPAPAPAAGAGGQAPDEPAIEPAADGAGAPPPAAPAGPEEAFARSLAARVHRVVEQPPFVPGQGGLPSTEKGSFAEARAALILLAVQLHALLEYCPRDFGLAPGLTISQLREADPRDRVGETVAVKVLPTKGSDKDFQLHVPVRSATTMKLSLPQEVLKQALRGIARYSDGVGTSWAEGDKWAAAALAAFNTHPRLAGRVPVSIASLVYMGLLPADWPVAYERAQEAERTAASLRAPGRSMLEPPPQDNGAAGGPPAVPVRPPAATSPEQAGRRPKFEPAPSPCVNLWWPPARAVPYADAKATVTQAQQQAQATRRDDEREKRLAAIQRRMGQS